MMHLDTEKHASRSWRDLRARVLSALLLAPIGLFCIWWGSWPFTFLLFAGLAGAGAEWAGLLRQPRYSLRWLVLLAWPCICCDAALMGYWPEALLMLLVPFALGAWVGTGSVVIGCAGLSLLRLRFWDGSLWANSHWDAVLFVLLVVWSSDSCAYFTGRIVGGPKLAPKISPGKTWSGSMGGLVGAACCAAGLALLLPAPPTPMSVAVVLLRGGCVGILLGIMTQCGDLAESALKRRFGVKDSGRLIPGHGGLLDRFDGLFVAAPVAALLALAAPAGAGFWYASTSVSAHTVAASEMPLRSIAK